MRDYHGSSKGDVILGLQYVAYLLPGADVDLDVGADGYSLCYSYIVTHSEAHSAGIKPVPSQHIINRLSVPLGIGKCVVYDYEDRREIAIRYFKAIQERLGDKYTTVEDFKLLKEGVRRSISHEVEEKWHAERYALFFVLRYQSSYVIYYRQISTIHTCEGCDLFDRSFLSSV